MSGLVDETKYGLLIRLTHACKFVRLKMFFYQVSRLLLMSTRFGGEWWVETIGPGEKLEGEKGKINQPLFRPFEFYRQSEVT